jgi:hypothetical protein
MFKAFDRASDPVRWPRVLLKAVIGVESLSGCRAPTQEPVLSPPILFWRQSFYFHDPTSSCG